MCVVVVFKRYGIWSFRLECLMVFCILDKMLGVLGMIVYSLM